MLPLKDCPLSKLHLHSNHLSVSDADGDNYGNFFFSHALPLPLHVS